MIPKIKIINDSENVYESGKIMRADKLIKDYENCCNDDSLIDWLYRIPMPNAIDFIAKAWGIEYEFC